MSSSPRVLAAGQLALLGRRGPALAASAPEGLAAALAQVPDPRDRRGIRYPLVPVLAISVCAMLAGARSYAAIAEWAADAPPRLRARLGLGGTVPDLVTIWRVLTAVDPAALDRAVGAWVRAQLAARRPGGRAVLAVDGKTVRGARAAGGTAPHLLACLDHATGVVLAQAAVDGKTNEISVFTTVLSQAGDLDGVLVTADALHAQRDHATWLAGRGAHYLVTVKGNQPGLLRRLRSLPWREVPQGHVSDGRGHGRIEKRILKVVTVAAGLAFPNAAQAIQVTRRTPPRSARRLDPRALEDREPAALGPRRHLRRGRFHRPHRHRAARHGHAQEPGHQHLAAGRPSEHRPRSAACRPRPRPRVRAAHRPQVTVGNGGSQSNKAVASMARKFF